MQLERSGRVFCLRTACNVQLLGFMFYNRVWFH